MHRKADLTNNEMIFVVETCRNSSSAIISRLPNAVVLRNQIPKSYLPFDLYCNLIPNEDENTPVYDQVPRTGSFEVSYKGMLIFSKLQSTFWPNTQLVGEKCYLLVQDEKENKDLTKYLAGNSPVKSGSVQKSRGGAQTSKSPIRGYNDTGFSTATNQRPTGSPLRNESQKFQNNPLPKPITSQQPVKPSDQQIKEEQLRKDRELKEQQERELEEQLKKQKELKELQEREQAQKHVEEQKRIKEQQRLEEVKRQQEEQKLNEIQKKKIEEKEKETKKQQEDLQMSQLLLKQQQEEQQQKLQHEEQEKKLKAQQEKQAAADKEKQLKEAADLEKSKKDAADLEKQKKDADKNKQNEDIKKPQVESKDVKQQHDPKFLDQSKQKTDTVPAQNSVHKSQNEEYENEFEDPEAVEEAPEEDIQVGPKLKTPDDIFGFPLFPPGTNSLLKKHMTRELWNLLKNSKDSSGFSFKQAIFPGCKIIETPVGVIAGSADSYKVFSDLFDKVIEDLHQFKKGSKHNNDIDIQKLQISQFDKKEAKLIQQITLRAGRNLDSFPFGPALNKEQRIVVQYKIIKALETLEGDFKGDFYPLDKITEDKQKLLSEHKIQFTDEKQLSDAQSLSRDWPSGRGVFFNKQNSLIVQVNKDDQVNLILKSFDADIKSSFEKLIKVHSSIDQKVKFSHDKSLGYLSYSPQNLGTGLQVEVNLLLNYLGQQKQDLQKIIEMYHLNLKQGEANNFTLSFKGKLLQSEIELMQQVYIAIKALVSKEVQLTPKKEILDQEVGPLLKSVEELKGFPIFPSATTSQLSKHLTREIYEKLHKAKDKSGYSFKQAIYSGCLHTDSGIGVYAGSHDSYHTFSDLFDKIVADYHKPPAAYKFKSDFDIKKLKIAFDESNAKKVKQIQIRVHRNLEYFPFAPALSKQQRLELEEKVKKELQPLLGEFEGQYKSLAALSEEDKRELEAQNLLFKESDKYQEAAGIKRDWPEGRGIYHNKDFTFVIWVNQEDHLTIISNLKGSNFEQCFSRLQQALSQLDKIFNFSEDEKLGFVTPCPTKLGSGMSCMILAKLPTLKNNLAVYQDLSKQHNSYIKGANEEKKEPKYEIWSMRKMPRTEVELIQNQFNLVQAILNKQKELTPKETVIDVKVGEQLQSPLDLTGFPSYPQESKSLVSKHLTKEIWDKLNEVEDKHGFTFKQAIFSGCKHIDSQIGAYAGSHDSYVAFAPLFDLLIQDHHQVQKDVKHQTNLDLTKLNAPALRKSEIKYIKDVKITALRNLSEYAFIPLLSKEVLNELQSNIAKSLQTLKEQYAGKYVSLNKISEEEKKEMIASKIMIQDCDKYLQAAGFSKEWPEGRGIFYNPDHSILVYINESDQMRIQTQQKTGDYLKAISQFLELHSHLDKSLKFLHDEKYGYITVLPANLGTGIKVQLKITIPFVSQNKEEFKKITDIFPNFTIDKTSKDEHTYKIQSKRTLMISEIQTFQEVYDLVKALITKEKQLKPPKDHSKGVEMNVEENKQEEEKIIRCGTQLNSSTDLKGKSLFFPPGTKSLLAQYCPKDVWLANKKKKDKYGYSFKQAVFSGCKHVESEIGVYAGSQDSYVAFAQLFNPIIQAYHNHQLGKNIASDLDAKKLKCPTLKSDLEDENIIVSTRIRVARNIADYPLCTALTKDQRIDLEEKIADLLQSLDGDLKGTYNSFSTITDQDKQNLNSSRFFFNQGDKFQEAAGLNRDWPEGRGVFYNEALTFIVYVNEEDQLRIISIQKGDEFTETFERIGGALELLSKSFQFAHDEQLGNITSSIANLGTGMKVSVHAKLPKLGKNQQSLNEIAKLHNLIIKPLNQDQQTDDIYEISNKKTLGISEVMITQNLYDAVKLIVDKERSL